MEPAPHTTPAADKGTEKGTLYHVYQYQPSDGSLEPVDANVRATSDQAALRKVVKETGQYVAIPARSFKPTKVTIAQETVVKLGGA